MVNVKVKHLVVDSGAFIKNAPVHVSYICLYYSKISQAVELFCLCERIRVIEAFLLNIKKKADEIIHYKLIFSITGIC